MFVKASYAVLKSKINVPMLVSSITKILSVCFIVFIVFRLIYANGPLGV